MHYCPSQVNAFAVKSGLSENAAGLTPTFIWTLIVCIVGTILLFKRQCLELVLRNNTKNACTALLLLLGCGGTLVSHYNDGAL